MSRHCPIWVKLSLGKLTRKAQSKTWLPKRVNWSKSTVEDKNHYSTHLESKLESLDLPGSLHCSDVHCSNPFHQQECYLCFGYIRKHCQKYVFCIANFWWSLGWG